MDIVKKMWAAYCEAADGVTYDGKPLPTWEELGEGRQKCWVAAGKDAADEIERLRKRVEVLEMDYGHSVKEGIDLANGWKDAVAEANELREEVKETKEKQAKVIQECRQNEIRHGEMIESLVNALARHDGHDELLKDARTYLEIIFQGHTSSKAYTDYKEWRKQRMGAWYEEYMRRRKEQRENM